MKKKERVYILVLLALVTGSTALSATTGSEKAVQKSSVLQNTVASSNAMTVNAVVGSSSSSVQVDTTTNPINPVKASTHAELSVAISSQTGKLDISYPLISEATDYGAGSGLSVSLVNGITDVYLGTLNAGSSAYDETGFGLDLPYIVENESIFKGNEWELFFGGQTYTIQGDPTDTDGTPIPLSLSKAEGITFNLTYDKSNKKFDIITPSGERYVLFNNDDDVDLHSVKDVYQVQTITDLYNHVLTFNYSKGNLLSINDDEGCVAQFGYDKSSLPSAVTVKTLDPNAAKTGSLITSTTLNFIYNSMQGNDEDGKAPLLNTIVDATNNNDTTTVNYGDQLYYPYSDHTGNNETDDKWLITNITFPSGEKYNFTNQIIYGYDKVYGNLLSSELYKTAEDAVSQCDHYDSKGTLLSTTNYVIGTGDNSANYRVAQSATNYLTGPFTEMDYMDQDMPGASFDPYMSEFPSSNGDYYNTEVTTTKNGHSMVTTNTYNATGSLIESDISDNGKIISKQITGYLDNLKEAWSFDDLTPYYDMPASVATTLYGGDGSEEFSNFTGNMTTQTQTTYDDYNNVTQTIGNDGEVTTYTYEKPHVTPNNLYFESSPVTITKSADNTDSAYVKNSHVGLNNFDTVYGVENGYYIGSSTTPQPETYTKIDRLQPSNIGSQSPILEGLTADTITSVSGTSTIATDSDIQSQKTADTYVIYATGGMIEGSLETGVDKGGISLVREGDTTITSVDGLPLKITDKYGNATMYTYDKAGRITEKDIKLVGSNTTLKTLYTYGDYEKDSNGAAVYYTTETDPTGFESETEYDYQGRVIATFHKEHASDSFHQDSATQYDVASGNPSKTIVYSDSTSGGSTTTYADVTTYAYDNGNRELAEENSDGVISGNLYDLGDGLSCSYTLDNTGNPVGTVSATVTDSNGRTIDEYVFSQNDLTIENSSIFTALKSGYSADGALNKGGVDSKLMDDLANAQAYSNTFAAIKKAITDTSYISDTHYTYDGFGNVQTTTETTDKKDIGGFSMDHHIVTTTTSVDHSNNQMKTVSSVGNTIIQQSDPFGDLQWKKIIAPNATSGVELFQNSYDSLGDIEFVTKDDGTYWYYDYNFRGDLESITNPDGQMTTMEYYPDGQVEYIKNKFGTVHSYSYDNYGNVSGSAALTYNYDGNLNGTSFAHYHYYPDGNVSDSTVTDTVVKNGQSGTSFTTANSYQYDSSLRPTVTKTGDRTLTAVYALGKLTKLTTDLGSGTPLETNQTYDYYPENGELKTITNSDGTVQSYTYDDSNNLLKNYSVTSSGTTLYSNGLTYDALGRVATKSENFSINNSNEDLTQSYSYNDDTGVLEDDALTSKSGNYPHDSNENIVEQQFVYDTLGNIQTRTNVYPSGSSVASDVTTYNYMGDDPMKLQSVTDEYNPNMYFPITYNTMGNMTTDWQGNVYKYNTDEKMSQVTGINKTTNYYTYDVEGNTGIVTDGNNPEYYGYNNGNLVTVATPSQTITYVPMGYSIKNGDSYTSFVNQFEDNQGNESLTIEGSYKDPSSLSYSANTYLPYGAENSNVINTGSAFSSLDNKSYIGEQKDITTGYMNLGNGVRLDDQQDGRFIQYDPTSPEGEGGINGYTYCYGDPINQEDLSGLAPPNGGNGTPRTHTMSAAGYAFKQTAITEGDPDNEDEDDVGPAGEEEEEGSSSHRRNHGSGEDVYNGGERTPQEEGVHQSRARSQSVGGTPRSLGFSRPGGVKLTLDDFSLDGGYVLDAEKLDWLSKNGFLDGGQIKGNMGEMVQEANMDRSPEYTSNALQWMSKEPELYDEINVQRGEAITGPDNREPGDGYNHKTGLRTYLGVDLTPAAQSMSRDEWNYHMRNIAEGNLDQYTFDQRYQIKPGETTEEFADRLDATDKRGSYTRDKLMAAQRTSDPYSDEVIGKMTKLANMWEAYPLGQDGLNGYISQS